MCGCRQFQKTLEIDRFFAVWGPGGPPAALPGGRGAAGAWSGRRGRPPSPPPPPPGRPAPGTIKAQSKKENRPTPLLSSLLLLPRAPHPQNPSSSPPVSSLPPALGLCSHLPPLCRTQPQLVSHEAHPTMTRLRPRILTSANFAIVACTRFDTCHVIPHVEVRIAVHSEDTVDGA